MSCYAKRVLYNRVGCEKIVKGKQFQYDFIQGGRMITCRTMVVQEFSLFCLIYESSQEVIFAYLRPLLSAVVNFSPFSSTFVNFSQFFKRTGLENHQEKSDGMVISIKLILVLRIRVNRRTKWNSCVHYLRQLSSTQLNDV